MKIEYDTAFWISPCDLAYKIKTTHIAYILADAELFNFTKEWLLSIYQKYNEKIGFEGKARREIMITAINTGWIRVRFKPRDGIWRVECRDITAQLKSIQSFVSEGAKEGWIHDNDKVLYSDFNGCECKGVHTIIDT